jgi:hypothetical protein
LGFELAHLMRCWWPELVISGQSIKFKLQNDSLFVWEERAEEVFSIIMSQPIAGTTVCTFETRMLGQFRMMVKDGIKEDD